MSHTPFKILLMRSHLQRLRVHMGGAGSARRDNQPVLRARRERSQIECSQSSRISGNSHKRLDTHFCRPFLRFRASNRFTFAANICLIRNAPQADQKLHRRELGHIALFYPAATPVGHCFRVAKDSLKAVGWSLKMHLLPQGCNIDADTNTFNVN